MVVSVRSYTVSDEEMRKSIERDERDPKYIASLKESVQQAKSYLETLKARGHK